MALIDQIEVASVWTASSVRDENDVGTLLLGADAIESGELISDVYNLVASAVAAGTGTITVSAGPNNPYNGRVVTGVPFDDVTPVTNIIPGVSLVFDASAANTHSADVYVGDYKGSIDATGAGAGTPTGAIRHRVYNDSSAEVADAKARLITQIVHYRKTGKVFSLVKPFAENATEKVSGSRVMPYALKTISIAGSGLSKTASLQIDDVTFGADTILDIATGILQDGTLLKAISTPYYYVVVSGPLEGFMFSLHEDCANNDIGNILVFPSRYTQIAPDIAGSAGTYGTADVDLTEDTEPTGVIGALGVAYYWQRIVVPEAANSESNPYPCNVALQATESEGAGWTV